MFPCLASYIYRDFISKLFVLLIYVVVLMCSEVLVCLLHFFCLTITFPMQNKLLNRMLYIGCCATKLLYSIKVKIIISLSVYVIREMWFV